jgi:hypothetical protein
MEREIMKIALVGESWGVHEEKYKHPLVWYTGRELAKMMAEAKLAPPLRVDYPNETDMIAHWKMLRTWGRGIAVTNVFNAHPPNDKTELFFSNIGETDLPSFRVGARVLRLRPEHRHHVERLWRELEEFKPNLVIALGNFACWALLGTTGISEIRGTPKTSIRLGLKVIPTFHPAALREWSLRPTIIADLTKCASEASFPEIRRIKRYITCEDPTTRERITIEEIEAWFTNAVSASYTVDIESGYALFSKAEIKNMSYKMKSILASLISMVSFARDPYDSIVIPFMTRDDPNLNYWKSKKEECKAWKITGRELARPIPKIFQNGIYDISHFLRIKMIVNDCEDDTMILQHAQYPELRKGLGYLASIHSNEIAWKTMRTTGESLKREE